MDQQKNIAFVIMGVSGVGKTTIGELLSAKTNLPFFDGDDFHSAENITKMASGKALNDADRKDWLLRLNKLIKENNTKQGCILACSALKESYRKILSSDNEMQIQFIFLQGSYNEILQRLQQRKNHFMSTALLASQFDTLEVPTDAFNISINNSPEEIVAIIQNKFFLNN